MILLEKHKVQRNPLCERYGRVLNMKVNLLLNFQRASKVAEELIEALNRGGIFGRKELPDDMAESLKKYLTEEEFLRFITLTTALDYMRNAEKLWKSSILTIQDEEVKWVFHPEKVTEQGKENLKSALGKHKLAMKKEKDSEIWFKISKALREHYGGSIKQLFETYDYDVGKMFKDFIAGEKKERFPGLSGIKLFPHWIRSLKDKTTLPFKNLHKLPIPVDVHIARATFTTGCITGRYSSKGINDTVRKRVIKVWEEGLKNSGIVPIEMFRPLWLLSKHGCHYRKNGKRPKLSECPVKRYCVEGKVIVTSNRVEIDT